MRIRVLILFILMCLSLYHLTAKDYQTFYSDREAYFSNEYGNIECIHIDSVDIGIDTILYLLSNIREIEHWCSTPYGPSWISNKIILMNYGVNYFFNKYGDTITINTNAKLNESWTVFKLSDSPYIIGKVTSHTKSEFLGQSDSVKTIEFEAYDMTMSAIDHPINQMTIKLSKHFGLIKTLNFSLFPNLSESYPWRRFEELNLVGLSKPKIGIQNIGWFDVFDFQPGDEIHVLYDYSCDESAEINKTITRYISRLNYNDSIVYEAEIEKTETDLEFGEGPTTYSKYNKRIVIQRDSLFALLPSKPIIEDDIAWYYSMRVDGDGHIIKTEPAAYDHIRYSSDSCWTEDCCWDGCWPYYDFYKGLGGPYYYCYPWCLGEIEQSLVYYKKGDVTWGAPFNLTSIDNTISKSPISIIPNPTSDYITIEIPDSFLPSQFEFYDLSGKLIFKNYLERNISQVSLENEMKGHYIYKIFNNQERIFSGTILIK